MTVICSSRLVGCSTACLAALSLFAVMGGFPESVGALIRHPVPVRCQPAGAAIIPAPKTFQFDCAKAVLRAKGCHKSALITSGTPTASGSSQYVNRGKSRQSGNCFPLST